MLAMLSLVSLQGASAESCAYDRPAMLALDEKAFDQDPSGGWRALDDRGCERQAADLIHDWREARPAIGDRHLLFWHEGQLRADIGQTAQAIALFERSRRPAAADRIGWNYYVDGSIAFLRKNRRAFDAAYLKLTALPKPADFVAKATAPDGSQIAIVWPMNLNVLDGFRRCWGQPYKVAYGVTCSKPMFRYTVPGK